MGPRRPAAWLLIGALLAGAPLLFAPAAARARATADDAYDSFEWYRMAKYSFEQRKDLAAAVDGLKRALDLDPDNAEARGLARYLTDQRKGDFGRRLVFEKPTAKPASQVTARWYDNALDAFQANDLEKALVCIERARQNEPTYAPIDLLERQIREQVSYLHFMKNYEGIEFGKPAAPEEKKFLVWDEALAKTILGSDVAYNPEAAADWLGLAIYLRDNLGDLERAGMAAKVAQKYDPKGAAVATFLKGMDERRRAAEAAKMAAEEKKKKAEEAARRAAEEKSRRERTVAVRETVHQPEGPKILTGANEFFELPYWEESAEVELAASAREIKLGGETVETVSAEAVTAYLEERFAAGQEKYANGQHQEALLEYEKAYLRALAYDAEDVRALFNLVLVYTKLDEKRAALEHFVRLLASLEKNGLREANQPYFRRVRNSVTCWVLGTVIQTAYLGYNASGRGRMTRETFVVSKLARLGYFNIGKGRKVKIKLGGPQVREREVEYTLDGGDCPSGGRYALNADNQVRCSVHGVSPLITEKYEFDQLGKK